MNLRFGGTNSAEAARALATRARRPKISGGDRAAHGWGRSAARGQGAARGSVVAHAHAVTFLTCASSGAVTRCGSAAAAMVSAAPRLAPSQPSPRSAACQHPYILVSLRGVGPAAAARLSAGRVSPDRGSLGVSAACRFAWVLPGAVGGR